MSGPKRNPDSLNTIGIVVIGVCASVLVYVMVVALQAFYMKDTAEVYTMADYGGTDTSFRAQKTAALTHINETGANRTSANDAPTSYKVPIDIAMKKVVEDAAAKKYDELVPGMKADKPTAKPIFGKSQGLDGASGSGSAAPADAGSGSAPAAGSGSAAAATEAAGASAPMTPTGGQAQGGGTSPMGTNNTPAKTAPGMPAAGSAAKGNAP